jgi:tRNA 2-selenouridine synthase
MIQPVDDARPTTIGAFDEIIDVRSPAEFAEDHLPGATNLPVLSNQERVEVGTLYVQRSKFMARRLGASYVSRNIADHLAGVLADRTATYAPLVYCWRGGQRSNAMATVLSQVGWRVGLLQGGYKTYRRQVTQALYGGEGEAVTLVRLCGPTGVGKTAVLNELARRGVQTLDLEAMAAHRGSLFGDIPGTGQPTQKMFESRIAMALYGVDRSRPVLVEDEASRIGALNLPPQLWRAMARAPGVDLCASAEQRARRIAADYGSMLATPQELLARIARLPRHHSLEARAHWGKLAVESEGEALAQSLIEAHYDPSYRRAAAAREDLSLGEVTIDGDTDDAIAAAADAVAALIGH